MKDNERRVDVGLTGGIACGKSEVARIWGDRGIPVLDTDRVAHEVMRPGTLVYQKIIEEFGSDIIGTDGCIHRPRLGGKVFASADLRERLNRLVHPAVREAWRAWREERRLAGEHAVVAIPLLFEVGADQGWDAVVCVAADPGTVMERLAERGLDREAAERRIAAQLPVTEKAERADFVIENNGTLEELERAAMMTWQAIGSGRT